MQNFKPRLPFQINFWFVIPTTPLLYSTFSFKGRPANFNHFGYNWSMHVHVCTLHIHVHANTEVLYVCGIHVYTCMLVVDTIHTYMYKRVTCTDLLVTLGPGGWKLGAESRVSHELSSPTSCLSLSVYSKLLPSRLSNTMPIREW